MAKYSGYSAVLGHYNGATYDTIAQVVDIRGPGLSVDTIEVTSRSSTNGWKEYVSGLKDGGELTFDIRHDPAGGTHDATTGLIKFLEDADTEQWQLTLADGTTDWVFDGIVTGFEPENPLNDSADASVTIKLTGEPTLA